ncbi:ArsR/SmtB family transcription factor [Aestuariirhabdus litorea]|uniref:ArsR family transcriptional regulator n=1 Tax=Aestuariirhabdus litorea TaxID=2528527 RepID=A0A3P3VLS5_9GAMM|nr:metalloregulator ArsR/SmtB family transcription factor [Aestuariirhabdus litorea]RRJ82828.1 ArsR family transcriptional regulator [Aestuariirhabdus litorea]RWW92987.1 ArsR family transcriptional regulator [Endozoicomonadaceae bacterium GTF-13]
MQSIPASVFKCLSDETRLRTLLLVQAEGELCVCEIAAALDLSQPKVSRHLAQLRNCNLLQDTRHGQWVYYQRHPDLSAWVVDVLGLAAGACRAQLDSDQQRLQQMGDRPARQAACC